MYQVVHIGEKEIPMLSMASIDNYYMQIFGQDPVRILEKNETVSEVVELFKRMGFVMAKFAELKDRKQMFKLNMDSYLDWLDQFERGDVFDAVGAIRAVYEGQRVTEANPKKKEEE